MADEKTVPPTEGISEETPAEEKPADAEGEETAEGEDKPEEEAAPEPETEAAAEKGGEPEAEQAAEAEPAAEEEVTTTEAEVTETTTTEVEVTETTTTEEEVTEETTTEVEVTETTTTEVEVTEETPAAEEEQAPEEATQEEAAPEPEPEQEQEQEQEPEAEGEAEPEQEEQVEEEPLELTEEETETFTALFDIYATEDESDGIKKITRAGIKLLFRFMGEIVTDGIISQMLEEEDKDVDGMLNLEEFCTLYKKKRQPDDKKTEELLMSVNTLFPCNGDEDDNISLDKVSSVLKHMNNQPGMVSENSVLTEDDINSVIAKIDTDGSNSISRQEFVAFLCGRE